MSKIKVKIQYIGGDSRKSEFVSLVARNIFLRKLLSKHRDDVLSGEQINIDLDKKSILEFINTAGDYLKIDYEAFEEKSENSFVWQHQSNANIQIVNSNIKDSNEVYKLGNQSDGINFSGNFRIKMNKTRYILVGSLVLGIICIGILISLLSNTKGINPDRTHLGLSFDDVRNHFSEKYANHEIYVRDGKNIFLGIVYEFGKGNEYYRNEKGIALVLLEGNKNGYLDFAELTLNNSMDSVKGIAAVMTLSNHFEKILIPDYYDENLLSSDMAKAITQRLQEVLSLHGNETENTIEIENAIIKFVGKPIEGTIKITLQPIGN